MEIFRLVRIVNGGRELQITSSFTSENLIEDGQILSNQHLDWTLMVKDVKGNEIWSNKKSVPGKAEDTRKNGKKPPAR